MTRRRKTKFIAIAACAANGIIGANNQIPWRIPADFKWFKEKTMGHLLVMGRKTFESIGKPLPGRSTIVLSRSSLVAGVESVRGLADLYERKLPNTVFIVGGGEIYLQCLPICRELFLTIVKEPYAGDTFFPDFEHLFPHEEVILDVPEFMIVRYYHKRQGGRPREPRIFQRWLRPGWGLQPRKAARSIPSIPSIPSIGR
jgi:dihydrofolate reductase